MDAQERASYQAFVDQHPESSFYHTMGWQRVVQDTYGYLPCYIVVEDAYRVTGVLPLFKVNSLISGPHLTAIPFSHHVAVLYENGEALQSLVCQAQQTAYQHGCGYIEVRGSAQVLASLGFQVSSHNWISQLDLQMGEGALWNNVRDSARRNVKKARKHNLTVRRGTGAADFSTFYRLMLETRRDQGVPPYPARLFAALSTTPQARLYLVSSGEQTLAGMVVFCHGTRAIYAYGASVRDEKLLRMRPNDLLFWHVINEMRSEGYETFDLGSTPVGNKNLLHFKENWGAQSSPLTYAYWLNTIERIPVVERDGKMVKLVSAAIRRMPLWALRLVGELLFKQLG